MVSILLILSLRVSSDRRKKKKFVAKSSRRLALVPAKKPKPRPGKQPSLKTKFGEKGKIFFRHNKKRIKKVDVLSDDDEEEEEIDFSSVKFLGDWSDD